MQIDVIGIPRDRQAQAAGPIRFLGKITLEALGTVSGMAALFVMTLTAALSIRPPRHRHLWLRTRRVIARSSLRLMPWVTLLAAGLGLTVVGQLMGFFTDYSAIEQALGPILVSCVIHELGPAAMATLVLSVAGTATVIELGTAHATGALHSHNMGERELIHQNVLPRVLGLSLSIFCLSIYFITLTLGFAYGIVLLQHSQLAPGLFVQEIVTALTWGSFWVLLLKPLAFGCSIGLIACYEGLVRPVQLEHLSAATIRSATGSILLCAVIDVLFIPYVFN